MYKTETQTQKFNTEEAEDLEEYDRIHNNPLCTILSERKEKLTEKEFDGEGNAISEISYVILVVTWQTKVLS